MRKRHLPLLILCLLFLAALVAVGVSAQRQRRQAALDHALYDAAAHGELTSVQRLLTEGASPNAFIWYKKPPPWYTSLIDLIHFRRPRPQTQPARDYALIVSAENGNSPIVKALLDAGADVNERGDYQSDALMTIASNSIVDAETSARITSLLLAHGADVRAVDESGRSALRNSVEISTMCPPSGTLRLLLAHGADPNQADEKGRSPFLRAAEFSEWQTVFLMLHYGADVNVRDQGDTSTLWAALTAGDPAGLTTLDCALMDYAQKGVPTYGDDSIARRLVLAGALPSSTFHCSGGKELPVWYLRLLHQKTAIRR